MIKQGTNIRNMHHNKKHINDSNSYVKIKQNEQLIKKGVT
jgi:hypothetical protein